VTAARSPAIGMLLLLVATGLGGACGSSESTTSTPETAAVAERLGSIERAVDVWNGADDLVAAQVAAEEAANLIVGPEGPGYGDRNGDGHLDGATDVGLLPGLNGTPPGLANALADSRCVERDVLGGPWDDPAARWAEMEAAIDAWRPEANTMPSLASHPMRVVGWSTFTLGSDSLDDAREYAGHARLHVDISADAVTC
jgi:hypothetical protein